MSDLQRRIEYIIESDDDTASKAERIAAMIEQRDRHIAKLAQVGMEQEAEIEAWRDGRTRMRHAMAAAGILNQFFADEATAREARK